MRRGRFPFWGLASPGDLIGSALGTLEQQVIDIVWRKGPVKVRDVHAELTQPVAYTTVMTTLDRLYRKGLLARTRASRAFVYTAVRSRQELEDLMAGEILSGLLSTNSATPGPLLSNLVEAVGDRDRELLGELERLVRAKLRRLDKKGRE